jgi:hypothetical protein
MQGNRPVVSVRVGDQRLRLGLKDGPRFRRQLAALKQIIDGSARPGELSLYQQSNLIMCKIVAWLPRGISPERAGTLYVRTDSAGLLVALNAKEHRLWNYHGDHILRWSAEHRKQLQRWSDDEKAEQRPVPPFAQRRENAARKYRSRMHSACHQVSAMIAGYAVRRRFAVVRYDDKVRDFCPQFPWFRLRELIAEKLDAAGITFDYVSGEVPESAPMIDSTD